MSDIKPVLAPVAGEVDETVLQLVLGLADPASFNRPIRFPTDNLPLGKSAFFQSQWKSAPGDNFSGLPVTVIARQDGSLQNNLLIQLPITTPLSNLVIARFRDMVRAFIVQDKNIIGGACPMVVFNRVGSTALRIDLLSGLSAVGEIEYGGAAYWPNAFAPAQYNSSTSGPWTQTTCINKVAPAPNDVPYTRWQGFSATRSAHGPVLGDGYFRHHRYIHVDGSPWAKPSFNLYRASAIEGVRTGVGICGYLCSWAGATVPAPLPTPIATLGGQWLTQAWLLANRINYDELFYLTAGCISICVCPQLSAADSSILPVGVYFTAKLYRYNGGAEKLEYITPVGVTLASMAPGDPYCVIPVAEPGDYRVEFLVWLDPADPQATTKQGNYTYSIVTNSLTEFQGHHMAPGLVSNNLNTLLDGEIARVDYYAGSTQENIADFVAVARDSNFNRAASSSSIKSAGVRANCLSLYDNTNSNNDGGSVVTAQLPTGTDWSDVMKRPRYGDTIATPPPAFQSPGLASEQYTDPSQNLQVISKHATELRMVGMYKSFHGLAGRRELELKKGIVACRMGQVRSNAPAPTLVSQFCLDYDLEYQRATVTVISASPNAVWFAPPGGQAQALASTSPLDFRVQIDMTGEYTTENMWQASSLQSSLTTWKQVEVAAYILGQLGVAAVGNDPIRALFSKLPRALQDRLDEYMRKGIDALPFGVIVRK